MWIYALGVTLRQTTLRALVDNIIMDNQQQPVKANGGSGSISDGEKLNGDYYQSDRQKTANGINGRPHHNPLHYGSTNNNNNRKTNSAGELQRRQGFLWFAKELFLSISLFRRIHSGVCYQLNVHAKPGAAGQPHVFAGCEYICHFHFNWFYTRTWSSSNSFPLSKSPLSYRHQQLWEKGRRGSAMFLFSIGTHRTGRKSKRIGSPAAD